MTQAKTLVAVRLEQYMINEILKIQHDDGMNFSDVIRRAISMFLKQEINKKLDDQWFTN